LKLFKVRCKFLDREISLEAEGESENDAKKNVASWLGEFPIFLKIEEVEHFND
jgi:hypothetical protein